MKDVKYFTDKRSAIQYPKEIEFTKYSVVQQTKSDVKILLNSGSSDDLLQLFGVKQLVGARYKAEEKNCYIVTYFDQDGLDSAYKEYFKKCNVVESEFRRWLFKKYNVLENKNKNLLYQYACEHCKSIIFLDIHDSFSRLIELTHIL
jgi:hypothetical protein